MADNVRYRTIDILTPVMIAVAFGVIFIGLGALFNALSPLWLLYKPTEGLFMGLWLLSGAVAGLIVRKPGAALLAELLAAAIEMLLGGQWAAMTLVSGVLQGLGMEISLAVWRYRRGGMRVAVVGTGASAIQVIPELAATAAELVVFQRTPAWVTPRVVKPYSAAVRRMFERAPHTMQRERDDIFWFAESNYAQRRGVPAALDQVRAQALGHLAAAVSDPELRERLTPRYLPGCKRVLVSNDYYPAMARDNVTLEDSALDRVEGSRLFGVSGHGYEVDVVVLCTGFEAAQPPFAERVHDGEGRSLADHWSSGMAAFDSTAVAGFPNLFAINGPNTSLGHNSIVYIIESQIAYILEALDRAEHEGIRTMVPETLAQEEYVDRLQERAATSVWLVDGGCHSWYVDPRSGKLTLIWPDYAYDFRARNGHFTGEGFLSSASGEPEPMPVREPERSVALI